MSWLEQWRRSTGDAPLYTEIHGDGEQTLVFIAGLGGTTRYWASRLGPIERRYRIVLVDLLGFGQSPKPWTQYSVERHVSELRKVLAPLGPVTLVGHSLGALITVAYAARHANDVHRIAVLGMPYFGSQEKAYSYMRRGPVKGGYLFTNVTLTMATCVLTRRVLGSVLPYLLRYVPREVAEDLVKHTWRSSTSSLWEVVYRYDAADDVHRLPVRIAVLCIHGDEDVMAPIVAVKNLAAHYPQWQLQVLNNVDHHPFLREPHRCLSMIEEFISSSNRTGAVDGGLSIVGTQEHGDPSETDTAASTDQSTSKQT